MDKNSKVVRLLKQYWNTDLVQNNIMDMLFDIYNERFDSARTGLINLANILALEPPLKLKEGKDGRK